MHYLFLRHLRADLKVYPCKLVLSARCFRWHSDLIALCDTPYAFQGFGQKTFKSSRCPRVRVETKLHDSPYTFHLHSKGNEVWKPASTINSLLDLVQDDYINLYQTRPGVQSVGSKTNKIRQLFVNSFDIDIEYLRNRLGRNHPIIMLYAVCAAPWAAETPSTGAGSVCRLYSRINASRGSIFL